MQLNSYIRSNNYNHPNRHIKPAPNNKNNDTPSTQNTLQKQAEQEQISGLDLTFGCKVKAWQILKPMNLRPVKVRRMNRHEDKVVESGRQPITARGDVLKNAAQARGVSSDKLTENPFLPLLRNRNRIAPQNHEAQKTKVRIRQILDNTKPFEPEAAANMRAVIQNIFRKKQRQMNPHPSNDASRFTGQEMEAANNLQNKAAIPRKAKIKMTPAMQKIFALMKKENPDQLPPISNQRLK